MFKTARFKVHNPSRHKRALLYYALRNYHLTLKRTLEAAVGDAGLQARVTVLGKTGKPRIDQAALERYLRRLAPKGWALAPLREYMIGDACAMLLSHFNKELKGENESNPPTLYGLEPLTPEQQQQALAEFAGTGEFSLKPEHVAEIEEARAAGQAHLARRLSNRYASHAALRGLRDVLRSMETPLPRPIEFTHCEFIRGFLLARKGDQYYVLVRPFAEGNPRRPKVTLDADFLNWKTKECIGGRAYPGIILPLEFGREFHEREYLEHGAPQSAKLLVRRNDAGQEELYLHIAFEFTPPPVVCQSFLGIDRGAAMIGAATIIDGAGLAIARRIDMEGETFNRELKWFEFRIAQAQRNGRKKTRLFRKRRRWAAIKIGEYANRVVAEAAAHRSQIVLEKIDERSMARFLTRSQFAKLRVAITYKAERLGLPKPIEVPAAYTSQTCARCGHCAAANRPRKDNEGRALQAAFRCVQCGYEANADQNASEIIALRGMHQALHDKFQKFSVFQKWLIEKRRVGAPALIGGGVR